MAFGILVFVGLCALALSEREPIRVVFAAASLTALASMILLVVGDVERSAMLAALLAVAVSGISQLKYYLSGRKLLLADVPLAFAGTIPFMMVQYRRTMQVVMLSGIALASVAASVMLWGTGEQMPVAIRGFVLVHAIALSAAVLWMSGGSSAFTREVEQPHGGLSTFMASILEPRIWRRTDGMSLSDMADRPLALLEPLQGRATRLPDLVIIQHESVFDPRLYGLGVDPGIAAFFAPTGGRSGALHVDIFGGGSWQSEFSIVTGLSSASFGTDAYFMLQRGIGRFRHTLPGYLASLGYRPVLVSSCRRGFLNYEAFYRTIGFQELLFSDDLLERAALEEFERTHTDSVFLDRAMRAVEASIARHRKPHFAFLLTNFNHGPHDRPLATAQEFEVERAFASNEISDPQFIEYYARLAETAAAWRRTRAGMQARHPNRPILVVHYGDHQPVMSRRIAGARCPPSDAFRQFRTFYAMEGWNGALDPAAPASPEVLDIALLGTVALQQAGLPLDRVSATRASLIKECAEGYFASSSERKRRLHRTLVEQGLVYLGPARDFNPDRPAQTERHPEPTRDGGQGTPE